MPLYCVTSLGQPQTRPCTTGNMRSIKYGRRVVEARKYDTWDKTTWMRRSKPCAPFFSGRGTARNPYTCDWMNPAGWRAVTLSFRLARDPFRPLRLAERRTRDKNDKIYGKHPLRTKHKNRLREINSSNAPMTPPYRRKVKCQNSTHPSNTLPISCRASTLTSSSRCCGIS